MMVKYPLPRLSEARPRCVAIQRRPPCRSRHCLSRCRPSPCGRLSRPRSTTAAPPRPDAISGRCACPPTDWLSVGEGDAGSLPAFTDVRCDGVGDQLSPRRHRSDRTSQSWPEPPAAHGIGKTREEELSDMARSSATARPIHQVLQTVDDSRGFNRCSVSLHLSVFVGGHGPSGSADPPLRCQGRSRPRPQPGVRPALNFDRPLRRPAAGLSTRTEHQRLAAHNRARQSRARWDRCRCAACRGRFPPGARTGGSGPCRRRR